MANSVIKRDYGIIHSKQVDVSGTTITNSDSGWYYALVNPNLPSDTTIIGFQVKNFDGNVIYSISSSGNIIVQSPVSKTLPSNRNVIVFYIYS